MNADARLAELGLDVPDFVRDGYYGASYGSMKPFHIAGNLLFLSGHVPQRGSEVVFLGRLGADGRDAAVENRHGTVHDVERIVHRENRGVANQNRGGR